MPHTSAESRTHPIELFGAKLNIKAVSAKAVFHWTTVILVGLAYLSIESRGAPDTTNRAIWTAVHLWTGTILIALTFLRIIWKIWVGNDANTHRSPLSFFSRLSNLLLLLFVLFQPLLGILTMNASGRSKLLFGTEFQIILIENNESLAEYFHTLHQWIGNFFYWVVAIHALLGIRRLALVIHATPAREIDKQDNGKSTFDGG